MQKKINSVGKKLASPKVIFWLLPFLIGLLVIGTVAQKYVGLYQATNEYFSSLYFTFYGVPLPGGYTLISILTVSIAAKLIFKSQWSWKKSGIILTHLGVLILMIGGLLTAFTQSEGFLFIPEGQSNNKVSDYHKRVLVIADKKSILAELAFTDLRIGHSIERDIFPFKIVVSGICENCEISKTTDDTYSDEFDLFGPAQFMSLSPKPLHKENERNIAGITLDIYDNGSADKYKTAMFEGFPKPVSLEVGGAEYFFAVIREKRDIPFSVRLVDFEKETYPGTTKASEYRSHIVIKDDEKEVEWPATISMNEPLRYRGYTLYQSSFDQTDQGEATVLSVVKNEGWLFSYFATFIFIIGLVLHLIIEFKTRKLS